MNTLTRNAVNSLTETIRSVTNGTKNGNAAVLVEKRTLRIVLAALNASIAENNRLCNLFRDLTLQEMQVALEIEKNNSKKVVTKKG